MGRSELHADALYESVTLPQFDWGSLSSGRPTLVAIPRRAFFFLYRMKTMNEIKAVLFDYGMVLSGPPLASAWEKMKTINGVDEDRFRPAYWAHRHAYDRGTYTGEQYWEKVAADAGVTVDHTQVAALIDADNELWTDLNPPMVEWAHQLQRAGIRTGILSNLGDHMMHGLLAKFPWIANFYHRTWSHLLKIAKPELEIYRHAAEGLETPAANILFIDDREENIAAAIESGMQAIRYTDHPTFEREMVERGFGNLLHLPAA